jgi:hypothetical protein
MTTRAALHDLVERLPESALPAAEESLERLAKNGGGFSEEFWKWLEKAPIDDEPLSEREIEALRRDDAGESEYRTFTEKELEEFLTVERRG